jgi:hypothetical protein
VFVWVETSHTHYACSGCGRLIEPDEPYYVWRRLDYPDLEAERHAVGKYHEMCLPDEAERRECPLSSCASMFR